MKPLPKHLNFATHRCCHKYLLEIVLLLTVTYLNYAFNLYKIVHFNLYNIVYRANFNDKLCNFLGNTACVLEAHSRGLKAAS